MTPWTATCQASPSFTISRSVLKFMSIESVMLSNHLTSSATPCSFCLQSFPASGSFPVIRLFTSGWPSFGASASASNPSNKYSRLISFRIDWFALLAVQVTLKCSPTPQFKSINSLALSLLYSPTLSSVHDYWKSITLIYMDLCQQS